ncbi:MAG: hypothetical protein ACOC0U_00970 [Desulfovibrionales bacterium]
MALCESCPDLLYATVAGWFGKNSRYRKKKGRERFNKNTECL